MNNIPSSPRRGMQAKTIVAILRKKINNWIATIEDEELRKLVKKDTIVTGGSIASMLLGEEVNDYDVYFKNYETTLAVSKYYLERFNNLRMQRNSKNSISVPMDLKEWVDDNGVKRVEIFVKSAGIEGVAVTENEADGLDYHYFETANNDFDAGSYVSEIFDNAEVAEESDTHIQPYDPVFMSTNAIALRGKIQIVTRFYGEPSEIHKNYDFVHCTNYWESESSKLTLHHAAMQSLLSRTLVYQGSLYPLCSVFRIRKFVKRGWNINVGQILKMLVQISNMDLTDYKTLKDQLTGVDVAYFTEVIRKLEEKDPEKVDQTYLIEIINRMF